MNLNKICSKVIEFSFYALFIIVPLILTPYNYELFEFNKMLTVYFLTVIIASAWIIKMIVNKKILISRTPFDIPLVLFLLSQILSTVFSIDVHTSLWGYYSRFHGGLISTICYLTLYFAFVSNNISVKKSLKVILSTAVIVSLYAIAEHFGIDKTIWVQDVQSRVFSTLGQPNWLAAYLIALVPLSRWLAPIFLLTIYFTKSQSGLGATLITLFLIFVFFLVKKRLLKIILIAALLTGGSYYLLSSPLAVNNQKTLQLINEENLTRLGGSSSLLIRRVVWQGAFDVWKHYPVFGSGVETFAYSYYNFRPAAHNLLSEWDFLYNKAHNEYVNYLATTGAFGLGTYLLFIFWVLIWILSRPYSLNAIALLLGFISILITNFFGFSVVPVALFFFLFPAFAVNFQTPRLTISKNSNYSLNKWQSLFIITILFLNLYSLIFIINLWRADKIFNLGHNLLNANQIPRAAQTLKQAVDLSPNEPLFRNDYSESLAKLAYLYSGQISNPQVSTEAAKLSGLYLKEAISQSDQVIQANPVHLNYWKSRIKVFLLLSSLDTKYTQNVVESLQKAIYLAPTDAKLYYNLGLIYEQINQTQLAKQALQQALELKPNYDIKLP
ncbi:MAG: O-antigen ligase family protein [Candidatus Beckwithbacteria bacterium]|nr:O-antigen ligase family protein [Candidatus Beckwithbacteria bacterium]